MTAPDNAICGTCTMCCKLLAIQELAKPVLQWCEHCDIGHGCTIYDSRPRSCRTYLCTYYQSVEEGTPWPPEMRPDRCHVVVDYMPATKAHYVRVDSTRPDAWRAAQVQWYLKSIAAQGLKLFLVLGEKQVPLKIAGR